MSTLPIASSPESDVNLWLDLLEVVLYGLGAGIGLSIAFALAMRGLILGGNAQRDGRGLAAAGYLAFGVLFTLVCVAAVGYALLSMVHR
ncbi:MAG: hypothetical protein JHD16_09630 [Solirubrobacteraceae bacterium]|nr:hypothetical protein [Solirubrobacteraceae bacterium]